MSTLTIYKSAWCGACLTEVPRLQTAARRLGLKVEVVDIDRCDPAHKGMCDKVDFVPTAILNGREVTPTQLEQMASKRV